MYKQKLSPVAGSTAAYNQSHLYRASSIAKKRVFRRPAAKQANSFFKSLLLFRIGFAVPEAPRLELDAAPLEKRADRGDARVQAGRRLGRDRFGAPA